MHGHGAVHPDGYGQAEDDEKDAQDHRGPAECQARQRQARSLFSGALDLAAGHVAARSPGWSPAARRRTARARRPGSLWRARWSWPPGVTAVVLAAVVTTVAG